MSKLLKKTKKYAAAALAAVLCITSVAVHTPQPADAASYCCHTIYRAKSTRYKWDYEVCTRYWDGKSVLPSGHMLKPDYDYCHLKTEFYEDSYACYKCTYTYTGYHVTQSHTNPSLHR